jgi:hypothetical protein
MIIFKFFWFKEEKKIFFLKKAQEIFKKTHYANII